MSDKAGNARSPWKQALIPALVASLALNAWHFSRRGKPAVGHWLTADGRAEYIAAYDEALAATADPADVRDVGADPVSRMIAAGTAHFSSARTIPAKPDDGDLAELVSEGVPVFVHLAADSTVTAPEDSAERARATLLEATVTVWSGTGHSLPMEKTEQINRAMLVGFAGAGGP